MVVLNVAEAKGRLSELVERAAGGEPVEITKRGKPMLRLVPSVPPRGAFDWEIVRAAKAGMTPQSVRGEDFVRRMRDDGR